MITDGDAEGVKFRDQLLKRGFTTADLQDRLKTLPPPRDLEDQLIADGHEALLRTILVEATSNRANQLSAEDFLVALKKNKIPCISRLALRVETDPALALLMPAPFVELVQALKAGNE